MAKEKQSVKAAEPEDIGYLDYLGIGGDETTGKGSSDEVKDDDRVAALLKTVEGLTSQVENMRLDRGRYPAPPAVPPTPLVEPTLKEVSLDGLPDQTEHPEEFAKGLNTRLSEAMRDNMRALSTYNTASAAASAATEGRSSQLWADFQEDYLPKLEEGLPENVEATPYVEVIARNIAQKAVRRGQNLDFYMYQGSFMEDVYAEAEKVLAPFRTGEDKGEGGDHGAGTGTGPTSAEVEAHRTGGIIGATGAKAAAKPVADDDKGLISDLAEVQRASGFF